MALHKLDIVGGKLMLDDALLGEMATVPPEGIRAATEASVGEGTIALTVRWTVETAPDQVLPLEFLRLRLGEFYPKAAFVGGRRYESSTVEPPDAPKLGFPYDTYYKFRIRARSPYDAALFTKMPLACWQERTRAFGIVFPKEIVLAHGPAPVFIRASGAEAAVDFAAALIGEFELQRKSFGWFGACARRSPQNLILTEGQSFEATFLLIAADTWMECVKVCEDSLYGTRSRGDAAILDKPAGPLGAALRFYDRTWDARNRTHVHLPVKNVPRFESAAIKHSHITDDLTKLVLYRKLIQAGCRRLEERERGLLARLLDAGYRFKTGDAWLWHTTTYFDGSSLRAFTHHGTGFVGFPGGMATVARRLFEYYALNANDTVFSLARSAAEWLADVQGEDGSFPATVRGERSDRRTGCVAATAETVRALIAAYIGTKDERYRVAAAMGLKFVNRDESFFDCRQYLRDVDAVEADGITAEACIQANLDWRALARDGSAFEAARKWAYYALQWVRPDSIEYQAAPSFDGLSRSITPRIDVWGGLLIARAFLRLSRATGEVSWRDHAMRLAENIVRLQERDGGFCETWFLDFPSKLESIHIEPTFVTDAFVELVLDLCSAEAKDTLRGCLPAVAEYRPLQPSDGARDLASISKDRPEWTIDGSLRLGLAFDGIYDWRGGIRQTLYEMMREIAFGRWLLKGGPALKILLNRYRIDPLPTGIGEATPIRVEEIAAEEIEGECRRMRYRTPYHDILLGIVSVGAEPGGAIAADLELDVKGIAGDLRVRQVRIDVIGHYAIASVRGKGGFDIVSGGNSYSVSILDGSVDRIIQDDGRLALDMSLSANWSFFGEYMLRLRVTRRAAEKEFREERG